MRSQNPLAWLGLIAVALPILVHLFSRKPARTAAFPSLRFLDLSRLLPTRRTQLSDLPMLLVRCAIVLFAVAALAQPLFHVRRESRGTVARPRVIVLDTLPTANDSLTRAAAMREVAVIAADNASSLVIRTDSPRRALSGAIAWLREQRADVRDGTRGELVVVSRFRGDALDSLDLAVLPTDIALRLVRTSALSSRAAATTGSITWATSAPAAVVDATTRAIRALNPIAFSDAEDRDRSHHLVVVSPDADSLAPWTRNARPLSAPWMGDVLAALHRDTTMSGLMADVTAAALPTARGADRLLLMSRAPSDGLATAALLLASSRARAPTALTGDTALVSDERLRRWERAPSTTPRTEPSTANDDFASGPSDARYFWLLVLLLLGAETLMRRRLSAMHVTQRPTTDAP